MTPIDRLYPHLPPDRLSEAEAQFERLKAAADDAGLKRSDEWLAEVAADAALRGGIVAGLWK